MTNEQREYNQKWVFGCSLVILLVLFIASATGILSLRTQRELARYPGARSIAGHSNYRGLPTSIRWDDAFRTADPFVDVYRWYSLTFDLGAEARASGTCVELEGEHNRLALRQRVTVTICGTSRGQIITVMRAYELHAANLYVSFAGALGLP